MTKALIVPLTIWNCVLSYKKDYFSENWLVLLRNYFQNNIPRYQLFATYSLIGGKWDFEVANLLLATVNFKPLPCTSVG